MSDLTFQNPKDGTASLPFLRPARFFTAPEPAGRRITAGFSFVQRIGKSASIDVWFPAARRALLDAKLKAGHSLADHDFPAEWAAVRQFELLQEAGNYKIYDLKVDHLLRTMLDLSSSMRAGGYRVTVVTLGEYVDDAEGDDLEILDQRLQEHLSRMLHMLYLDKESASLNDEADQKIAAGSWNYRTALPHIGVTLGARDIFRPANNNKPLSDADRRHRLARRFFDIVEQLPSKHIIHDTAVSLQLPNFSAGNEATYCALGEDSLHGFSQAMSDIFSAFDRYAHGESGWGIKSTVQHMRGYGEHTLEAGRAHLQRLACACP